MDTHLLDYKLKELFGLSKKIKLSAVKLLIESVADDAVYDNNAERETNIELDKIAHIVVTYSI